MAKKDKKDSKQQDAPTPADAVRGAVEQAFAATFGGAASTRGLAQDLVEEIGSATSRVRQAIDELRVVDDLRVLRSELEALNRRVESLEAAQTAAPAKRPRASAGTKPAGTKPAAGRARSAAAARKDAAARQPAEKRKASTPRSAASARKAPATKPPAESSAGRS
jgi:BMFP domain-containing protein YqiC